MGANLKTGVLSDAREDSAGFGVSSADESIVIDTVCAFQSALAM